MSRSVCLLLVSLVVLPALPAGAQVEIGDAERVSLHLSVYNNGMGVITDERALVLPKGDIRLALQNIAMTMDPRTASLGSGQQGGFVAKQQNYRFDLLNRHSLLERFIGRKLKYSRFIRQEDGYEKILREGILLSIEPEIVRFGDVIEIQPEGTISLPYLPTDLITEPTLFVSGTNNVRGRQDLTLRYHATGLSWEADYELYLDRPGSLDSWVVIHNHSGADLDVDRLRLVAGDVNRAEKVAAPQMARMAMEDAGGAMVREPAGDYHAYTYPSGAKIENNQVNRLRLLSSEYVTAHKEYRLVSGVQRYAAGQPETASPSIWLSFDNSEDNGLGQPLPMGVVRVYESGGEADLFLGEARIGHIPADSSAEFEIGRAFDVQVERTQTDFTRLGDRASQVSYRLIVTNGGDNKAEVELNEQLFGDWEITSQNINGSKVDAMTYGFRVEVPARGATEVTYSARIRW